MRSGSLAAGRANIYRLKEFPMTKPVRVAGFLVAGFLLLVPYHSNLAQIDYKIDYRFGDA